MSTHNEAEALAGLEHDEAWRGYHAACQRYDQAASDLAVAYALRHIDAGHRKDARLQLVRARSIRDEVNRHAAVLGLGYRYA